MDAFKDIQNLLKDPHNTLAVGTIADLDLAEDRSVLRALVRTWPDNQEIVCRVTWDYVGPNAGIYAFPQVNDLVLIGYSEKDEDQAMLIKRLSSKEDYIPESAVDGSIVIKSIDGLKTWISSNTRINLSRGVTDPVENLVIGKTFKETYINHFNKLISLVDKLIVQRTTDSTHTHLDGFGIPTNVPDQSGAMNTEKTALNTLKGEIEALKNDDVVSNKILSDFAYTEK